MAEDINVKGVEFKELMFWEEVEEMLENMPYLRLPNAAEAVYIDYKHQAIWVSDTIGDKHCVMDRHWGIQTIRDGCYGLILLKGNKDEKERYS